MEQFLRDGKWLSLKELWEYNKNKEVDNIKELEDVVNELSNNQIEIKEEDMAKCKTKKKSKK